MITVDYGGGEGGKKCQKIDYVICERPLSVFTAHCSLSQYQASASQLSTDSTLPFHKEVNTDDITPAFSH